MEDVHFAAEDEMDDEQEDDDDVEMDFGEETGSEDTSNTEEEGDENDLDNQPREPEEVWQDEDDEDGENLVENEEENEEEDEDDEDDVEVDDEMMWQVCATVYRRGVSHLINLHLRALSMAEMFLGRHQKKGMTTMRLKVSASGDAFC